MHDQQVEEILNLEKGYYQSRNWWNIDCWRNAYVFNGSYQRDIVAYNQAKEYREVYRVVGTPKEYKLVKLSAPSIDER